MITWVSVTQVGEYAWRLDKPLDLDGWTVPAGYVTDFATIPQILWALTPRYGSFTAATVLHDWLITDALPAGLLDSREVDKTFRDVLGDLDVSFMRRWLMWTGVRWGALFNPRRRGGWAWLRDLPLVALVSLLALPLILPAACVLPSLLVFSILDRL